MARTQKEIVDRLMAALEGGNGGWDDLNELMDRVKRDIAESKQAEAEERKRKDAELVKRGEEIAEMATRVLQDKATEADVALVMESYMHNIGCKDAKVTAAEVREAKETAEKAAEAMDGLLSTLGEWANALNIGIKKEPKDASNKSADDVLRDFLKKI